VTRTPLSRSKGQGHQAGLLTVAFTHLAAAAVSVGTYRVWETAATLPSAVSSVLRRPHGEQRWGGIPCYHAHSLLKQRMMEVVVTAGLLEL